MNGGTQPTHSHAPQHPARHTEALPDIGFVAHPAPAPVPELPEAPPPALGAVLVLLLVAFAFGGSSFWLTSKVAQLVSRHRPKQAVQTAQTGGVVRNLSGVTNASVALLVRQEHLCTGVECSHDQLSRNSQSAINIEGKAVGILAGEIDPVLLGRRMPVTADLTLTSNPLAYQQPVIQLSSVFTQSDPGDTLLPGGLAVTDSESSVGHIGSLSRIGGLGVSNVLPDVTLRVEFSKTGEINTP